LYAPGLAAAGIDLERLLVAVPPRADLGRVAVKIAQSGAFDVVVIDMDPASSASHAGHASRDARENRRRSKRAWPSEVLVRKLALAVEDGKTHVLLLTDSSLPRVTSWPVCMRLDVVRDEGSWQVTVGKERRGRIGLPGDVPLLPHQVVAIAPLAKAGAQVTNATHATNVIAPAIWSKNERQSRSRKSG
jgi:hypothetical protein